MKEQTYLTFEQVKQLLPQFSDAMQIGRKQIYSSSMGRLYFKGSKKYDYANTTWWYAIAPNVIIDEKIDYLILVAGLEGVFVISSKKFLSFKEKYAVRTLKCGRESIDILTEKGQSKRRSSVKGKYEDWTDDFIPIKTNIK
ncbi:MAG: hypothetical protein K2L79_00200 [Bacteroidales bacterium]|nr:hypothetical protein [Bacteroidales bacterium]